MHMEFKTPTSDLTIIPDRDRLLMSDALKGRVPELEDALDTSLDDEHAVAGIDAAVREVVTLVVERYGDNDAPEHLIGPLVAIECDPTGRARLSLRVPLEEALTAVHDAMDTSEGRLYAGAQVHRDEEADVIRVGPSADVRRRPAGVAISEITLAGTCTLTVTLS